MKFSERLNFLPGINVISSWFHYIVLVFLLLLFKLRPTLQSIGDESIALLTFCHSSARAAIGLGGVAYDWPGPSPFWVQRRVGRGQQTGRVWICGSRVVDGAVPSEAAVRLSWGSVPSSVLPRLCCHLIPKTPRAGAAVGWRQQLPLRWDGTK